jgi:hypothetical protein
VSDLERYLAPPAAQQGGDPLIDELKARQRTQAAMGIVRDGNPEQAGRANELGRIFNVPPDTIERNLPAFEAADRERQATQMMTLYPAIGKWAADPRHAAVAKDDIHHLARMSAAFHQWDQQRAAEQVLQVQRGQEWAKTHGTLTAPPPRAPTAWNFARGIAGDFVQAGIQMRAGLRTMVADLVGDRLTPKSAPGVPQIGDFGRQHAILEYERAQAQMGENQPAFKTDLGRGFYAGVSSLAQMLPATIASVATGNPAPVLTYAGASQATQSYAKYRSRGASPSAAGLGAAGEGAVEVATEYLPMKYFVSKLAKAGAGEFVSGLLLREIPSEQVATHVQDAIDAAIANPDMTLKQYRRPAAGGGGADPDRHRHAIASPRRPGPCRDPSRPPRRGCRGPGGRRLPRPDGQGRPGIEGPRARPGGVPALHRGACQRHRRREPLHPRREAARDDAVGADGRWRASSAPMPTRSRKPRRRRAMSSCRCPRP